MNIQDFLKWYAEAYSSGDANERNYVECAIYLEGFIAAHGEDDGLKRCVNVLRGGHNLISTAKRKGE